MTLDLTLVTVFVLVLARTSAWLMAAPVFSSRGLPSAGRLALALALSLFLAPLVGPAAPPGELPVFIAAALGQIVVGLVLGWLTGILFRAFEVAGAMIDTSSGFAMGALFDPMSGSHAAVFSRFSNLLFVTLLVATNAHHLVVRGFVRTFEVIPVGSFPDLGSDMVGAAVGAVGLLMLAAIEIAAPVLGVLFLTEVALALAARFAPQANVFLVGLPLKVLVALFAMGSALVWLPSHLNGLVEEGLRIGGATG